ncbi:hypothetical protein DEU56DRAFT_912468 [Suillus clintonianus]|uniref:uncharacterized protein n=1 Tax=Suillus clintonianus TaxID=1904413 RepID=UPI001B884A4F|nr:uncharacterized protein DEU56DRAFT_912468 [Suillus clintonianus]KAG2138312.1 hypothetical protein DEU56DRAFT_912468 [Suillus clintonianus]
MPLWPVRVAVLRSHTTHTSDDIHVLVLRTDAGHRLLAQFRRTQNTRDLDQSIRHFERAVDLCVIDHPCCSAALFNLASVKFVNCQVNGLYLDHNIPTSLFQHAFDLRPTGHPDRPITQLCLAIALLSRFTSSTLTCPRHNVMKDFPGTLAVDAASCALRSGDVCRAVELLDLHLTDRLIPTSWS